MRCAHAGKIGAAGERTNERTRHRHRHGAASRTLIAQRNRENWRRHVTFHANCGGGSSAAIFPIASHATPPNQTIFLIVYNRTQQVFGRWRLFPLFFFFFFLFFSRYVDFITQRIETRFFFLISSMKFSKFNRLIEFTKWLFKNKDYVFFFLSFPFFFFCFRFNWKYHRFSP